MGKKKVSVYLTNDDILKRYWKKGVMRREIMREATNLIQAAWDAEINNSYEWRLEHNIGKLQAAIDLYLLLSGGKDAAEGSRRGRYREYTQFAIKQLWPEGEKKEGKK